MDFDNWQRALVGRRNLGAAPLDVAESLLVVDADPRKSR